MEFCKKFIESRKKTRNGQTFGLLMEDVLIAIQIAELEGKMYEAALHIHKEDFFFHQMRLRDLHKK